MKCYFWGRRRVGEHSVRYYLLAERLPEGRMEYGFRLVIPGGECAELPSVTVSRRRARRMLGSMLRGAVTPVSLHDIVEDQLAEEFAQ